MYEMYTSNTDRKSFEGLIYIKSWRRSMTMAFLYVEILSDAKRNS